MAYERQNWTCGEVITAEKLNHMEDGIADAGGSGGGIAYYADLNVDYEVENLYALHFYDVNTRERVYPQSFDEAVMMLKQSMLTCGSPVIWQIYNISEDAQTILINVATSNGVETMVEPLW